MSCSRRDFMAGMGAGALIMMTGTASANTRSLATPLAHSQTIDGVRYGMIHDETACIGCTACMDACREVNQVPQGVSRLEIIRSGPVGEFPDAEYRFFRKSCQHCDNAPCVHVCPTDADLCVGCMYCLAACPYQVRFINPVTRVADKCDFCRKTNLAAGKEPACVESCPTKALVFGNLDDPDSPIAQRLVKETTYRYKQALGTSPKMYRVPKGEITS